MSRTGRGRGRARAEIAVARVLEKRLGALPVVAEFGRRLRMAEIIDELCPVRPVAWISHGEVIEALVANRLTAPAPLVRVQEWAAAITEFGVDVSRLHWDLSAPRGADRSSGGERPPPPSCRSKAVKLRAV